MRRSPIRRRNPRRYAARQAAAFGPQADMCRSMRCCACGRWGSVPHHTIAGQCREDRDTVPLCPDHHTDGPDAVHRLGRKSFEARHGVDLREIAAGLARRIEQENERHDHS